ncbi:hypothetical protein V8C42DRAFT_50247 [Trichoderma barbatum]
MEPTVYNVDADGDTILILQNANQAIQLREDDPVWENALPKHLAKESQLDEFKVRDPMKEDGNNHRPEVWMLLSSKKLALVSSRCRQMTPNNQPEIRPYTYKYLLVAKGWDEKALEMVMNIIHGHTTNVPGSISLEMLAKIAVIVDYFRCSETVRPYADKWISRLKEPFPTRYGRNLVLRLFVSWVFLDEFDFKAFTATVIRQGRGPMHTLSLPIPKTIIAAIDKTRQRLIDKLFFDLYVLKSKLSEESRICSSIYPPQSTVGCATILPDALVEGMKDVGLTSPPQRPFNGYSIVALEKALRGFRQPPVATMMWSCDVHGSELFLPVEISSVLNKQQFENIQGLDVSKLRHHDSK